MERLREVVVERNSSHEIVAVSNYVIEDILKHTKAHSLYIAHTLLPPRAREKFVLKQKMDVQHVENGEHQVQLLEVNEVEILSKISHEHIVQFVEAFFEMQPQCCVFTVLEYVDGDTIMQLENLSLQNCPDDGGFVPRYTSSYLNQKVLGESFASRCLLELVSAVAYLHAQGIVHRDIKIENILLTRTGHVKLVDFDCAEVVENTNGFVSDTAGTWLYWPPEVCADSRGGRPFDAFKVDVWAVGICLWILLHGAPPYYSDSPIELFDIIAGQGNHVNDVELLFEKTRVKFCKNSPLIDVFDKLLSRDPATRPTMQQCLDLKWLRERTVQEEKIILSRNIHNQVLAWMVRAKFKCKQQQMQQLEGDIHVFPSPPVPSLYQSILSCLRWFGRQNK